MDVGDTVFRVWIHVLRLAELCVRLLVCANESVHAQVLRMLSVDSPCVGRHPDNSQKTTGIFLRDVSLESANLFWYNVHAWVLVVQQRTCEQVPCGVRQLVEPSELMTH